MMRVPDPRLSAGSARASAMSMAHLHLRRVTHREAIAHALWEAGVCLRASAFCACLAMLRKALDLWSLEYRGRHQRAGEGRADAEDLAGRLTRFAAENRLYAGTIAEILDALHCEETGTAASPPSLSTRAEMSALGGIVCRGGYATSHDGYAVSRIKDTYRTLHEQVLTLITATTLDLPL